MREQSRSSQADITLDLVPPVSNLLATTDLDKWARAEAMPSEEEIRRLIEGL